MSEKISYEKKRYVTEENTVEVKDIRNCFFTGNSEYDGTRVYKGIYVRNRTQIIVEIRQKVGGWIVEVDGGSFSANTIDVKSFFEKYRDCRKISGNEFFGILDKVLGKFGTRDIVEYADQSAMQEAGAYAT